jgi:hypothetical protein
MRLNKDTDLDLRYKLSDMLADLEMKVAEQALFYSASSRQEALKQRRKIIRYVEKYLKKISKKNKI